MTSQLSSVQSANDDANLLASLTEVAASWRLLIGGAVIVSAIAACVSMVLPAVYTAQTVLLPPQPQSSLAGSQLGSLAALGSLAGVGPSLKNPVDQYVGLLQSRSIADRMVDQFKLMDLYGAKTREDARMGLALKTAASIGRKDGLLTIEVTDADPARAAAMANQYVTELRRLSSNLAITEAQQRRKFFESQLDATKEKMVTAQRALEQSGFSQRTLRAEPKAAAEQYAALQAQVRASEVRMRMLQSSLADKAPEVVAQSAQLSSLRSRLAELERSLQGNAGDQDYLTAYREFKYQETLFELFARQFEVAKADESREGAVIQVVDEAQTPERRSAPKRGRIVIMAALSSFIGLIAFVLLRRQWRLGRVRASYSSISDDRSR
jgi:uncharacterized protein involved in exopolysaccharide biosynthesis